MGGKRVRIFSLQCAQCLWHKSLCVVVKLGTPAASSLPDHAQALKSSSYSILFHSVGMIEKARKKPREHLPAICQAKGFLKEEISSYCSLLYVQRMLSRVKPCNNGEWRRKGAGKRRERLLCLVSEVDENLFLQPGLVPGDVVARDTIRSVHADTQWISGNGLRQQSWGGRAGLTQGRKCRGASPGRRRGG